MNKILLTLTLTLTLFSAHAETMLTEFYVGGVAGAGFAYSDKHYMNSASYGAIAGLQIPLARAEIEYNHITASRGAYDAHANTVFGNAYLRATMLPIFHPYIGAGAGHVWTDGENKMGYQGMIGTEIDFPILPFALDAEMRYMYSKLFQDVDIRLKARVQF